MAGDWSFGLFSSWSAAVDEELNNQINSKPSNAVSASVKKNYERDLNTNLHELLTWAAGAPNKLARHNEIKSSFE